VLMCEAHLMWMALAPLYLEGSADPVPKKLTCTYMLYQSPNTSGALDVASRAKARLANPQATMIMTDMYLNLFASLRMLCSSVDGEYCITSAGIIHNESSGLQKSCTYTWTDRCRRKLEHKDHEMIYSPESCHQPSHSQVHEALYICPA